MTPLFGRLTVICGSIASVFLISMPAATATPENPFGSDYVAIVVAPAAGITTAGRSGTMPDALQIAMGECIDRANGARCLVAQATQYGCVAAVWDKKTQDWSGGRGADENAALLAAASGLPKDLNPDDIMGGTRCSDPITPP